MLISFLIWQRKYDYNQNKINTLQIRYNSGGKWIDLQVKLIFGESFIEIVK